MKLPICSQDAEKGQLCTGCEEKLQQGEINKLDVELSKILYKLNKKNTISNEVNLIKTKELEEDQVIALVEGDPSTLIGKGGRIIRMISEQLGKEVRVVKNGSVIQITNDLITPARACGINTLYRENGETEKYITVPREHKSRINIDLGKARKALNKIAEEEYGLKFI